MVGVITHVQLTHDVHTESESHELHLTNQSLDYTPANPNFHLGPVRELAIKPARPQRMSRFWSEASTSSTGAAELSHCPVDLDGDLLQEPPARDRIADVPMVQMKDQSITVGIAPSLEGRISSEQRIDYSTRLELKDSFNMQFSGLLSVEGGLNLGSGLKSLLSWGNDGMSRSNSLGFNARNSLEYSTQSEHSRQQTIHALDAAEKSAQISVSANDGFISIQFEISNTGSQAVILGEPSFAVVSQLRDAQGKPRLMTVVPETPICAPRSATGALSSPSALLNTQTMEYVLPPGESRTIALRLTGQNTAVIRDLMRNSRATWATLHFGTQVAKTDSYLEADGSAQSGAERDLSRELVSRVRKRTIPFLFQPPRQHPFGEARTTLLAAAPAGVRTNDAVHCWRNGTGDSYLGATLPELFRYHGNVRTNWQRAESVSTGQGAALYLPSVGGFLSSLSAHISPHELMALPQSKRHQLGRWEVQVYHRDYGPIHIENTQEFRLRPEHAVHLRWVTAQTLLDRQLPHSIVQGELHTGRQQSITVRPGDTLKLNVHTIQFQGPFYEEHVEAQWKHGRHQHWVFGRRARGDRFDLSQLPGSLRQQLRVRYAFVSRHTTEDTASWRQTDIDEHGQVNIGVPNTMEIPHDAQLVVRVDPIWQSRREGMYLGRSIDQARPQFIMGRTVRQEYHLDFELHYERIPQQDVET